MQVPIMPRLAVECSEMMREELGRECVGEPLHHEEEAAAEQDEREVRVSCQVRYMERFARLYDGERIEKRHEAQTAKATWLVSA